MTLRKEEVGENVYHEAKGKEKAKAPAVSGDDMNRALICQARDEGVNGKQRLLKLLVHESY